jgi:protein involved in polysaccharide export with SLBB domain
MAMANCIAINDLTEGPCGITGISSAAPSFQTRWFMLRFLRAGVVGGLLIGSVGGGRLSRLSAQSVSPAGTAAAPRREYESRSELEAQASSAESARRTQEAWLLRQRLVKGDFQDGDKIWLNVQVSMIAGNLTTGALLPDTLVVRAGRRVELGRFGELSLEGVLRSELTEKIRDHLAQYVKDPMVRTTPLVRVGILGSVGHPGFFYSPADRPLSDVLMLAGGPTQGANVNGITVKRGEDVIWTAQDTHTALADGMSLDRMHLRAGDEITVPQERHVNWWAISSFAISLAGIAYSILR